MEWRSVRFDWNRARAFLVAAEEGSFSAAARALQLSQPTVGRQVAALEGELGVALFERVGHRLALTAAGGRLLEHVRGMGEAATRMSLAATGQATDLEGSVVITASQLITAHLLAPAIAHLRSEHPGLTLELVAANDLRDLHRREADIAVRNVAPDEPELIGRNLGARDGHLYGSSAYLTSLGPIRGVEDLQRADYFAFPPISQMITGARMVGLTLTESHFPIHCADHLAQWELVKRGLGLGWAMTEVGDAEPLVQRAWSGLPPLPVPIWLVAHREVRTSRRIRVVFDALADALALSPASSGSR